MSSDLWDREFDRSEYDRVMQRDEEQRDAEELARRERLYDYGGAYEIRDPKHPRHHEVMADIWDAMA